MATKFLQDYLGTEFKEGMTVDELSEVLEKKGIGTLLEDNKALKTSVSKANSEAAAYKKQLREKQTEEEKKNADYAEMQTQLETLKHEMKLSALETKFAKQGYTDSRKVAEAFMNGDVDTILAEQETLIKTKEDALKAELIRTTPKPTPGGVTKPDVMTEEKLYSMPFEDRMKYIKEHRAEYDAIFKTNE